MSFKHLIINRKKKKKKMIKFSTTKRQVAGMDEDVLRVYATAQKGQTMSLDDFARHIATHGSVYGRDVIYGVLLKMVDCLREKLLEGYVVELGELGSFYVNIVNANWQKLPEDMDKFNAGIHIVGVNVVWRKGAEFKTLYPEAEFEQVTTRAAQSAVLAAVKKGETVVDLSVPKKDEDTPDEP